MTSFRRSNAYAIEKHLHAARALAATGPAELRAEINKAVERGLDAVSDAVERAQARAVARNLSCQQRTSLSHVVEANDASGRPLRAADLPVRRPRELAERMLEKGLLELVARDAPNEDELLYATDLGRRVAGR